MAAAPVDTWPTAWVDALRKALADRDERVVRQAVSVVRATDRTEFEDLAARAGPGPVARGRPEGRGAGGGRSPVAARSTAPLFEFLVARLRLDEPPLRRMAAARALGRAPLDDGQLLALTRAVGEAGALMLPRLLPAFERSRDPRVGAALVAALGKAPGLPSLTPEDLERTLRVYPEEVQHQAEPLFRRLQTSEAGEGVAPGRARADPGQRRSRARGREVFFGTRATCSTCHTIRSEGGHVGPDLSRIGAVRSGRDLLEAILFPSASFARGYEPFIIATNDGRVHSGIIARETSDAIVLVTPDRLRDLPPPLHPSRRSSQRRVSVMPRGLDANLNRQELADLVAFLQSLK